MSQKVIKYKKVSSKNKSIKKNTYPLVKSKQLYYTYKKLRSTRTLEAK